MKIFSEILKGMPQYDKLYEAYREDKLPVHLYGMSSGQKSHLIYTLLRQSGKKCLVVTTDEKEAGRIKNDLSFFFSQNVVHFKEKEYVFFDADAATRHREISRIKALCSIPDADAVVTTIDAICRYTLPKADFDALTTKLVCGDIMDFDVLAKKLVYMGYKRTSTVEGVGQFSIRGSILDIYSPLEDMPARIEFFDDEVDSLRYFDRESQLSVENAESIKICPVRELVYDDETRDKLINILSEEKNQNFYSDIEKISQARYITSIDKYYPLIKDRVSTLCEYIDDEFIVFFDEPSQMYEKNKINVTEQNEIIADLTDKGLLPKFKGEYMWDYAKTVSELTKHKTVSMSALSYSFPLVSPKDIISFTVKAGQSYMGNPELLAEDLKYRIDMGQRVIIAVNSKNRLTSLSKCLDDNGIFATLDLKGESFSERAGVTIVNGDISKGFEYPTIKVCIICENDIYGEQKNNRKSKAPRGDKDKKNAISGFDDIHKGDYVVHKFHGIGRYEGIAQLTVDKVTRDYLKIKYKGSDVLYVPANQLDVLHKYIGAEAESVKVNSLSTGQWHKTVSRVRKSVEDMAKQLIELYAKRKNTKGYKFDKDNEWQSQFEQEFAFTETPDQLSSIKEVKHDMESGICMDRLLCGDVGYGKTEVAIRAAFKCVMNSKQVAYLVPTTLLAQQHYNNFKQRMEPYGINVEMMSRFRSKKQNDETLKKLKSGMVDVVIGTHRIVQKDMDFKDLGLVIIDEEQRFGVAHKEKLKELKNNVDVLTLSATPIPRTLNMAMVGIRDLSVITTPPEDRFPVQTFIMEHNDSVIQNAIQKELQRGGQVFYLYNRVDGIEKRAEHIRNLVPDAVVEIAHGQMNSTQIESKMLSMLQGDIDVLVCTTIIETGLDISNANTIIIENAHRLGLAQLYQLRGRVGRSNRLAYAYLTYTKNAILDETARKRLEAIKDFTEFGSGFKIAMRDLEIRGAGNLLGSEQHGNMNLVGYDMYCNLLEEAVKELKGEEIVQDFETKVDIKIDAYIPETYIAEELQRIEMYKKISAIETEDDLHDTECELIDRFSDFPSSVANLMQVSYIKSLAHKAFITDIIQNDSGVRFTFNKKITYDTIADIIKEYKGKIMFSSGEKSYLLYKVDEDTVNNIKFLLQKLINTLQFDKLTL